VGTTTLKAPGNSAELADTVDLTRALLALSG
jgi:hypothetical protein